MSALVESIVALLEDSFSTGSFRITARKFASKLASDLKTKVRSLTATEEVVEIAFDDGSDVRIEVVFRDSKPEFKISGSWVNGRYFEQWKGSMTSVFDRIASSMVKAQKNVATFKPSIETVTGAPGGSVGLQVTHKPGKMAFYTARKAGTGYEIVYGARAKSPSRAGEVIATVKSLKDAEKVVMKHATRS